MGLLREPPRTGVERFGSAWPSRRSLLILMGVVLLGHLAALLSLSGGLDWQLSTNEALRTGPLQTRWISPVIPAPSLADVPPQPAPKPRPRTRVATEKTPSTPAPTPPAAQTLQADTAPPQATDLPTSSAAPTPATAPEGTESVLSETASAEPTPTPSPSPTPEPITAAVDNAAQTPALQQFPIGALPPSSVFHYRLTGLSKGLTYHASGELRWQSNAQAYALSLSVKAFLIGTRHWRSVGAITPGGLAPTRFSDSWRSERAAHFDRDQQRVVFSNNAPVAELTPGAQDQVSLYVQLAAAMAGSPQGFQPGTRLQIQTVTIKDALPWVLTLESVENLRLNDQPFAASKWVYVPRNRFDAKVEFWVAEKYAWMPARIRISQLSGDFIDLILSAQEPLPPLASEGLKATAS